MTSEERITAEGLAALATTAFERGLETGDAEAELMHWWRSLGSPVGAFDAAAAAIRQQPQPLDESPRATALRESLGGTSVSDQLVAALRARELLENLGRREG